MYKVTPYVEFNKDDVELPKIMYNSPLLNDPRVVNATGTQPAQTRDDEVLVQRILALDKKVNGLLSKFQCSAVTRCGIPHDIVVFADPVSPPVALRLIVGLLVKSGYRVGCSVLRHSSCTSKVDCPLLEDNVRSSGRSAFDIIVTLIWKDILDPRVHLSAIKTLPINGYANLCRLFGALYLTEFLGSQNSEQTWVDYWLDEVESRTCPKADLVESMTSHLKSHKFLVGDNPSMADLFVFALLLPDISSLNLPPLLKAWVTNCKSVF